MSEYVCASIYVFAPIIFLQVCVTSLFLCSSVCTLCVCGVCTLQVYVCIYTRFCVPICVFILDYICQYVSVFVYCMLFV